MREDLAFGAIGADRVREHGGGDGGERDVADDAGGRTRATPRATIAAHSASGTNAATRSRKPRPCGSVTASHGSAIASASPTIDHAATRAGLRRLIAARDRRGRDRGERRASTPPIAAS